MMEIGIIIRGRRVELGLTQAQLAERIHVSTQAISKWETGTGLPDISQIVPLAMALEMTTDKLLSSGEPDASLERRWQEALKCYGDDPERLLAVSVDILREYPNHPGFLFRAAVDEHCLASRSKDVVHLCRARYYGERLISLHPDHEEGKELLVIIYKKLGEEERALELAQQCHNRDLALKTCLTGDALRRHRQKIIDPKAESLLAELIVADEELLNRAEKLVNMLYPGECHPFRNRIEFQRAHIAVDKGEQEGAREILENLLHTAPTSDRVSLQHAIEWEFPELML